MKFKFSIQLAVEYESNVKIIKVDTDDEYEFARDMQVIASLFVFYNYICHLSLISCTLDAYLMK